MADDAFRDALHALCRRALGGPLLTVERLSGGASQELWSLDVGDAAAPRGYVLRRSPGGGPERASACGLATEAAVITAAGAAGVPVAAVAHVLTPEDGLGPGFIAERVGGEALGRRVVRDAMFADVRPRLAAECGAILARIHATPLETLPPLERRTPVQAIAGLRALLASTGQARPVAELALRWLDDHAPASAALTLAHGDFRTGNFLLEPMGVRAVLDWEGVHLGDPMSDLGWLCAPAWRFGVRALPVGGFGTRGDLFAGYERESGRRANPEAVRFWEVFAMLRWSLICVGFGAEFTSGADPSVERGAIGRRASESEYDLMEALAPRAGMAA